MPSVRGESWRTIGVLAFCGLVLSVTLAYRFGLDQGVFAYMGAELLEGRWPYVDTWDHAFPGVMFLHAAEILLLGKSIVAFRIFDLVWQLCTVFLIYRITGRIGGRAAGLLGAGIYALIYQSYGPWNTGQREGFGLLFGLIGFWLFVTAERRKAWVTAAGIGLGLGLAVTIKPTLLSLAALYAPLLLRFRPTREHLVVLAAAVTGLLVPPILVALLFAGVGGLQEMIDACINYQMVYVQRNSAAWWSRIPELGASAALIAVVYPPFLLARRQRPLRLMLYVGYLGTVYAVLVQGTFGGYHYLPGLGIGAILIGTMFAQGVDWLAVLPPLRDEARRGTVAAMLAALALTAALPLYVRSERVTALTSGRFLGPPAAGEFTNETVFDFTEDWELAAYLRERTDPDDRIQVWGHESLVYYLAERRAASRFQTSNPLVMRVPGQPITAMQQGWREEFLDDLDLDPPRYIAVVRLDNWWWAPENKTSEELLDDFPDWRFFIEERYLLETEIGRFLVYRRSGD